MLKKRIAVFGSSMNPPGNHHVKIVSVLTEIFDIVKVVPCGIRPDKKSTGYIDSLHRRIMSELAFDEIIGVGVELDLFDIDSGSFTRTVDLISRYEDEGEVWIIVGGDIVLGGGMYKSEIHKVWKDGARLWEEVNFVVICRPGYVLDEKDFPPKSEIITLELDGSSSKIRSKIESGQMEGILVPAKVLDYILEHKLYFRN